MKDTVILYHASCPDGFGGAYSAWKKFGDTATYRSLTHEEAPPLLEFFKDREVYFIDFCYKKVLMDSIQKTARRLVVLDHHSGMREVVESIPEHIFDNDRSGAGIAWNYFHPDKPLPRLLAHVQDVDLWKFALPHTSEISAYMSTVPFDFERWDSLTNEMEQQEGYAHYCEMGSRYKEYGDYLAGEFSAQAQQVEFEGYTILAVNAPHRFATIVGNMLAKKRPPFAIVWYFENGYWQFSLRGTGEVDLAALAKKYGGGGHHNASGFHTLQNAPLPFTFVKK